MKTRTSDNWKQRPGNWDKLHMNQLFPSDNIWGIPQLEKQDVRIPIRFIPYNLFRRQKGTIHFFIDDYRFETVWSRPIDTISRIKRATSALTPDFSLFLEMPLVAQMWNVYRNRWVGRYWQENGIDVIPTVSWSSEESFPFCFQGIEEKSTVAIATTTVLKKDLPHFVRGLEFMLKVLKPKNTICYGTRYKDELKEYPLIFFETYRHLKKRGVDV